MTPDTNATVIYNVALTREQCQYVINILDSWLFENNYYPPVMQTRETLSTQIGGNNV